MKANASIAFGSLILAATMHVSAATLPLAKTENGVAYVSGGVGQDEAAAMRAEAKHYPMSIFFTAGKDNAFLANVKVTISDKAGKEVLNTTAGPILLVKAPPATYAITAVRNGRTLHRTVHVQKTGEKQIVFHWPKA